MRSILSEKNIVMILFVMVLITFSLAQEDSKKMEKVYTGINSNTANRLLVHQSEHNYQASSPANQSSIPVQ